MNNYDIIVSEVGKTLEGAEDVCKSAAKLPLTELERTELKVAATGLADDARRFVQSARTYRQGHAHFTNVRDRILARLEGGKLPSPSLDEAEGEGRR